VAIETQRQAAFDRLAEGLRAAEEEHASQVIKDAESMIEFLWELVDGVGKGEPVKDFTAARKRAALIDEGCERLARARSARKTLERMPKGSA
jgi:hypothetical protein